MQEALAKHFAPAECLVLGCRLQPFSLWHWRLFDQLDLPLWPGEFTTPLLELVQAVRLLCLPANSDWKKVLRALRVQPLRLGWIGFTQGRRIFAHEEALGAYLQHYFTGPLAKTTGDGPGTPINTHPALYLAMGLVRAGLSESEAWATPPGFARWKLAAAAEADGHEVRIVSDSDIALAREAGYTEEQIFGRRAA